jgi:hypothetical protein
MTIDQDHVTVSTVPTLLAALDPSTGERVHLKNIGSEACYIGNDGVSPSNGFELAAASVPPNEESVAVIELAGGESVWGAVAAGTTVVEVLRNFLSA